MYNHHIGYANAPLFFFFFFCIWECANSHVHQCAYVAPSVSEQGHGVQNVIMKGTTNKASRDKRGVLIT